MKSTDQPIRIVCRQRHKRPHAITRFIRLVEDDQGYRLWLECPPGFDPNEHPSIGRKLWAERGRDPFTGIYLADDEVIARESQTGQSQEPLPADTRLAYDLRCGRCSAGAQFKSQNLVAALGYLLDLGFDEVTVPQIEAVLRLDRAAARRRD